jgi:cation:H+ antiporter
MLDTIVILIISLLVLGKSAKIVIDSALVLARFFRVSELAVGFILLSVATFLPELVVTLTASVEKQPASSVLMETGI